MIIEKHEIIKALKELIEEYIDDVRSKDSWDWEERISFYGFIMWLKSK